MAYFFVGDFSGQEDVASYTSAVRRAIAEWHASAAQYNLFSINTGTSSMVLDTRTGTNEWFEVSKAEELVLQACDRIASRNELERLVVGTQGLIASADVLDEILARLIARRLALQEGEQYLSVVIPLGEQ
jgi:hypothetical protein